MDQESEDTLLKQLKELIRETTGRDFDGDDEELRQKLRKIDGMSFEQFKAYAEARLAILESRLKALKN